MTQTHWRLLLLLLVLLRLLLLPLLLLPLLLLLLLLLLLCAQAKASLQYCAAFEAEPEEDAFDLLAAGDECATEGGQPSRRMQVCRVACCESGAVLTKGVSAFVFVCV
jgi:hypothetical protein